MTDRFHVAQPLYPLISIAAAMVTLIGGLVLARSIWGSVFVAAIFLLLCCFGYARVCLRLLPFFVLYLALFFLIFALASGGNTVFAWQMVNRLGGVAVAVVPGLSLPPVRLTRCLTRLHAPRLVTLGMLITTSFIPVLGREIRQVRAAMRTRGVISLWNPTAFYRALLIPLLVRLVNISDTLALSVETRGFMAEDVNFTIFHPVELRARDVVFSALFLVILACCVVAGPILGVGS